MAHQSLAGLNPGVRRDWPLAQLPGRSATKASADL